MNFHMTDDVRLILPHAALTTIFDECDRYDDDETGGRVLGTFKERGDKLTLEVTGLIEPGPSAQRSAVSFFQDGAHQEQIFRQIERKHPEIEHLGNWHTHHMNGLTTLSGGDIDTYRRIVSHPKQNTPFFYALLVVAKRRSTDPLERYSIKHYLFRRGDDRAYQVNPRMVEIVDTPLVWPVHAQVAPMPAALPSVGKAKTKTERVYDRDILGEFFPRIHPFTSQKLGVYWRGPIELLDGANLEVVVVEDSSASSPSYSIVVRDPPESLEPVAKLIGKQAFGSARAALITTERHFSRALFEHGRRSKGRKWLF